MENKDLREQIEESPSIKVSRILDEYLPSHGVDTQREKLRESLHCEILKLIEDNYVRKEKPCSHCSHWSLIGEEGSKTAQCTICGETVEK